MIALFIGLCCKEGVFIPGYICKISVIAELTTKMLTKTIVKHIIGQFQNHTQIGPLSHKATDKIQ